MWSDRAAGAWVCCLLALPALVLLVYAPALGGYFAADDFLWVIHDNARDAWQALSGSWGLGLAWRPLSRLDLWLDARLFGWSATPWHAVNLVLHAANGVLVAGLARRIGLPRIAAWLSAALFLTLPIGWENVDWISGRTGLLCLLFLLAASLGVARYVRSGSGLSVCCLCQGLALLAYEPAAAFPAAVLAAGYRCSRRPVFRAAAALGGTVALLWLIRWGRLGSWSVGTDVAGAAYLPQLGRNTLILAAHLWRGCGAAGLGIPILAALGLWRPASRRPVAGLLAASVVLYLPFSPVAGFTERFFYLSSAPLALALGRAASGARLALPLLAAMVGVFGWLSHRQAEDFAAAGQTTRAILSAAAALPGGQRLVCDGVPTHQGRYYLLWGNFEDAVAAVRHAPEGEAATSEWVLSRDAQRRAVLAGNARFYRWDDAARVFRPITRQDWMAAHGLDGMVSPARPGSG